MGLKFIALAIAFAGVGSLALAEPAAPVAETPPPAANVVATDPGQAAGTATVYIYRPHATALMLRSSLFSIDGVLVSKLGNHSYVELHVPAGIHAMQQRWPLDISFGMKQIDSNVEWKAGQTYYYRFSTTASVGYGSIAFLWRISDVDVDTARVGMFKLRQSPAMNLEQLTAQPAP